MAWEDKSRDASRELGTRRRLWTDDDGIRPAEMKYKATRGAHSLGGLSGERRAGCTASSRGCSVADWLNPECSALFEFANFNPMQVACLPALLESDGSVVVSAPTGAGKTVLFELAAVALLTRPSNDCCPTAALRPKVLYLAPLKALCDEKVEDWTPKFRCIGAEVVKLTGDCENLSSKISSAAIIVATPEMWDSFSRRSSGAMSIARAVELVCLDEVHMLNLARRGAVLEGVVARLRMGWRLQQQAGDRAAAAALRMVAVSATVPNVKDIGEWLGAPAENVLVFGPEHRPVPLRTIVRPISSKKNEFLFQEGLNSQVPAIVRQYASGRGTLVFCVTKKACETAARAMLGEPELLQRDPDLVQKLTNSLKYIVDPLLKQLVRHGVAVHNAGLSPEDRRLVSELFLCEALLLVFCTQTLALGVNFPARLVVVKGTTAYRQDGGWEEYDALEMQQMIGRAGRPRFDIEGVAVILTEQSLADTWQKQLHGGSPIESHLGDWLTESLLAEAVAQPELSEQDFAQWLQGTFLKVRASKDPKKYAQDFPVAGAGPKHPLLQDDGPHVGSFVACLLAEQLQKLEEVGLVTRLASGAFSATKLGVVACRYSVRFKSVQYLVGAALPHDLQSLFELLAGMPDFAEEYRPKQGQKGKLREWAMKSVRWTSKHPVDTAGKKVSTLLQLALADPPRLQLPWELKSQQQQLLRRSEFVLRLFIELFLQRNAGAQLATTLLLKKCLKRQIWESSGAEVRQLPGIGDIMAEKLKAGGLGSLAAVAGGDPRLIEVACGRRPPFGNELQAHARSVPRYELQLSRRLGGVVAASIEATAAECKGAFSLVAYDAPTGLLLRYQRFPASGLPPQMELESPADCKGIVVKLIHEEVVGIDLERSLGDVSCSASVAAAAIGITVGDTASKRRRLGSAPVSETGPTNPCRSRGSTPPVPTTLAMARERQERDTSTPVQLMRRSSANSGCHDASAQVPRGSAPRPVRAMSAASTTQQLPPKQLPAREQQFYQQQTHQWQRFHSRPTATPLQQQPHCDSLAASQQHRPLHFPSPRGPPLPSCPSPLPWGQSALAGHLAWRPPCQQLSGPSQLSLLGLAGSAATSPVASVEGSHLDHVYDSMFGL